MKKIRKFISSHLLFESIIDELTQGKKAVFTVTGMSMWPFLCHERDQVVIEKVSPEELRTGDIILFRLTPDRYLLHRITALNKDYFQTTGDHNLYRDMACSYDCLVARVWQVVRDGRTIDCKNIYWRLLSRIWMFLFPVRRWIIGGWMKIRKYIKRT